MRYAIRMLPAVALMFGSAVSQTSIDQPTNVERTPRRSGSLSTFAVTPSDLDLPKETWEGTATVQCQCEDGSCRQVTCSVSGEASYESARSRLEAKVQAEVRQVRGRMQGGISFSIKKRFAPQTMAHPLTTSETPQDWKGTKLPGISYRWGGGNGNILYIRNATDEWKRVNYYDGVRWRRVLLPPRFEDDEPAASNTGTLTFEWAK